MRISLCVIAQDEEANIGRCLKSAAEVVDEMIVLDSGSRDATAEIARQLGARVVVQEWLGYVGQKNKVLSLAQHEWVLSLDADEELSPELREEFRELKRTEPSEGVGGFSMPRCVFYEGRWIRHGDWYPDRLVRLFRREKGRFAGGKVHERLELEGKVEQLRGEIYHYSFRDAADHWARCQKYARLWAESAAEQGRRAGPGAPVLHALFRFLRGYVLKRGFLDGKLGLRIATLSAREVYLKYKWLREMRESSGSQAVRSTR